LIAFTIFSAVSKESESIVADEYPGKEMSATLTTIAGFKLLVARYTAERPVSLTGFKVSK